MARIRSALEHAAMRCRFPSARSAWADIRWSASASAVFDLTQNSPDDSQRLARAASLLREAAGIIGSIGAESAADTRAVADVLDSAGQVSRARDALLADVAVLLNASSTTSDESHARRLGFGSSKSALQIKAGVTSAEAHAACSLPRRAADVGLERVTLAFHDGRISLAQLRAITNTVVREVRWLDEEAVASIDEAAERFATGDHSRERRPVSMPRALPEDLEALVRSWVLSLSSCDAEAVGERRRSRRYLRAHITSDQLVRVSAQLPLDDGGDDLLSVIQAARSQTMGESPADAAADARSHEQRAADILSWMIRAAMRVDDSLPRLAGESPSLMISVPEAVLRRHAELDLRIPPADRPNIGHATTVQSGEAMPVIAAMRILCDGAVRSLLVDDHDRPLRLGRTQRLFSWAQRRALTHRHKQCASPGCTVPPGWCEAHHVRPWGDGGATDIDNGILLCGFHHHEVHRARLEVVRDADGGWLVRAVGARSQ